MEVFIKKLLVAFFTVIGKVSPQLAAKIAWPIFCTPRIRKKPLSFSEKQLANQAKRFYVDYNGNEIAVFHWAANQHSSDSSTILFTHGWGGHAFNFTHIFKALLTQGYNIVAFDGLAHGASTGKRTTLIANTEVLLKVASSAGPISTLIGHSFGSITSAYAVDQTRDSETLSQVKKLILISGPNKLTDIFSSFTQAMSLPNSVLKIFYNRVEKLVNRPIESMNTVEFIQSFKGQTLLIHDKKDRVVPFTDAETITSNNNAQLFATDGLGHSHILSAPDVVNKIIEFLETN